MDHPQYMWKPTFRGYGRLNHKMFFTYIGRWGEERTQKWRLIRQATATLLFKVKIRFKNSKSLYYEDILHHWKYQPIAWVDTTNFTSRVIVGKCVVKDVYTTFKGKYLGYSLTDGIGSCTQNILWAWHFADGSRIKFIHVLLKSSLLCTGYDANHLNQYWEKIAISDEVLVWRRIIPRNSSRSGMFSCSMSEQNLG